ncbi:MAG: hypothetical protein LN588_05560 [Rickettsia endosymbiont of Bryobia graminum]|nr:hypothetical protein [Rickettsia endosymbiont of Bryobia graminum]
MKKTYNDNEIKAINSVSRNKLYQAIEVGDSNTVKSLIEKEGDILL